jgi:hypothetical protein
MATDTSNLPQDTRGAVVIATIVVLLTLTVAIVGLRFFVRAKILNAVGPDDWVILGALVHAT